MTQWSEEARRMAASLTRSTYGGPVGGYTPAQGLAHFLNRASEADLEWEAPLGQWEAMMSQLTSC